MGHQAELDQMSLDCLPGFDKRRDTSLLKEADVIILDFELAGIQAPQLIAEFKRLDIKASILVISQDPGHKENLTHDLKVQAFLPKSVGYAAIFQAAEKISWQRKTDALRWREGRS